METVLKNGLTGPALIDATKATFIVAGIAALVLAAFSLTLPHTPPKKTEEGAGDSLAFVEAAKLLKLPFVMILWLVTFADSFIHNCYFNWTGRFLGSSDVGIPGNWIMPVMSIGQIAEIGTMAFLGIVLKKLGWRATMVIGILGHVGRFAVYSFAPNPALIVGVQILHGICYAFFFATVYIFVDAYFPKDARTSAQGLFNVMILGIGALAANFICPWLLDAVYTDPVTKAINYRSLFMVPATIGLVAAVALALFFHPPAKREAEEEAFADPVVGPAVSVE
jgi:MFS family permease